VRTNPNTRRTRLALRLLQRQYGDRVDVYHLVSSESDPRTGQRQEQIEVTPRVTAIVLPNRTSLQELRGISLISANKRIVQGGQYEGSVQNFIIDSRDLPETPTTDDWLVYQGRRYDFEEIGQAETVASWVIQGRAVSGRAVNQVFVVGSESLLSVVGGADAS
jgi:hypothetical protein